MGDAAPAGAAPRRPPREGQSWAEIVEELGLVAMAKQLAQHCELVAFNERGVELKLPHAHEKFLEKSYQERLKAALRKRFGADLPVSIVLGETTGASPVEIAARERELKQARAVQEIERDPFVQELVNDFGGRVSAIKPTQ